MSQQVDQEETQRDKKMLWWNLEPDHRWTLILKMLNSRMLQRKLA